MNPAITWNRYPQAVALNWFAKGIGAARSGEAEIAQMAPEELTGFRNPMSERGGMGYWVTLTAGQIGSVSAWIALSEGDHSSARTLVSVAADKGDAVGKALITPRHVLPARELLGDMLMKMGEWEAAARAYQAALDTSPNRARSMKGFAAASDG